MEKSPNSRACFLGFYGASKEVRVIQNRWSIEQHEVGVQLREAFEYYLDFYPTGGQYAVTG